MSEAEITRQQIIVVKSVGENSYKDLTFTDMEGHDYKISNKRRQWFEDKIFVGTAIQLNYAMAYRKEYIYSAEPKKLSEVTHPDISPEQKALESPTGGKKEESHINPRAGQFAPQEIGLWFKEIGEMIRAGKLPANDKEGKPVGANKALIMAYYSRMNLCILGDHKEE